MPKVVDDDLVVTRVDTAVAVEISPPVHRIGGILLVKVRRNRVEVGRVHRFPLIENTRQAACDIGVLDLEYVRGGWAPRCQSSLQFLPVYVDRYFAIVVPPLAQGTPRPSGSGECYVGNTSRIRGSVGINEFNVWAATASAVQLIRNDRIGARPTKALASRGQGRSPSIQSQEDIRRGNARYRIS